MLARPDGTILMLNEAAAAGAGKTVAEMIGANAIAAAGKRVLPLSTCMKTVAWASRP